MSVVVIILCSSDKRMIGHNFLFYIFLALWAEDQVYLDDIDIKENREIGVYLKKNRKKNFKQQFTYESNSSLYGKQRLNNNKNTKGRIGRNYTHPAYMTELKR